MSRRRPGPAARMLRWFGRVRRTLRFRITLVATLVVGVALTFAAGALVEIEQRLADADLDLLLNDDLDAVSAELFAGATAATAAEQADRSTRIVVETTGDTVRRDWDLDQQERRRLDADDIRRVDRSLVVDGELVELVAERSTESARGPGGRAAKGAFGAVPFVTALVAVVVWRSVGRALRPVEQLRADADVIADSGIDHRLGRPGTGDEVDRLAATLNSMLDQLADADARQRRLIADAAHELRSPLAGLRARLETAGSAPDDLDQVRRLQDLVDSLLLLSRSDAGQLRHQDQLVDLDEIVEEAILGLGPVDVGLDVTGVTPQQARGDQHLLGPFVVDQPDLGRVHAPGGAIEQPHAQPRLERRDMF